MQVQQALANASGPERDGLLSLQSDIKELIQLTKESLAESQETTSELTSSERPTNTIDDQYDLFKVCI